MATRPESGLTRPASSASRVDFPAPLRPTTPTRSPADTPSETPSSSVRCAYALAAFSRLIRFTAARSPSAGDDGGTGHRPAGPGHRPAHARAGQRRGQVEGAVRAGGQEHAGRSRAGHQRAERAQFQPGRQGLAQRREQRQRGRLQVVAQRPADQPGIARAQRRHERGVQPGRARDLFARAGPLPVQRRVHLGRGQVAVGEGEHPVVLGRRGQRLCQLLAPAAAYRGPAEQREGHVAAHPRGDLGQLRRAETGGPELVAGDQRRGRVAAAAGQPGRHRDPFGDRDVHAGSRRHLGPQRGYRAQRQVVPVGGDAVRALAADRDPVAPGGLRGDLVEQRDGVEDRHQVVVAISTRRTHRELEVEFGGHPHGHTGHDGQIVRGAAGGVERRDAASRANSAISSDSPRAPGSRPAARSRRSASGAEPAQPDSAARSVLRRCRKAASTTANTSSRLAAVAGGSRRVNATSRESTFGTGQNTLRGTGPAGRAAANQASFADGVPYTRDPGGAHIRSATSAWTMTSPRRSDGSTASRCSSTGTATLYGRFATSTDGDPETAGRSPPSMRSASAATTASRSASPGARAAIVPGSSAASTGSISTPTTRPAPAASRASVSDPSPGPTSSTTSRGSSAARAAIRRTVPGSTTKFWPSRLDGRTPSRPASSLISPGVSSRTAGPSATTAAAPGNRNDVTS